MGKQDNSRGEGPIGGIDPQGDGTAPAFDVGYAPYFKGQLERPIREAEAFAAEARGRIQAGLTRRLMEVAVDTDGLIQKVAAQVAAPIQAAAQFHGEAGQRIGAVMAQPLFDAASWGEQWGAFPELEPGLIPPARVLEARAAFGLERLGMPMAPDGGKLVVSPETYQATWQHFRDNVLPVRAYDFNSYVNRLQEVESRFPPGSTFKAQWERDLAAAEADSPIGINPDAQAMTKPLFPSKPTSPAPGGGEPVPVSGGVPTKPGPRPIPIEEIPCGMGGTKPLPLTGTTPGNTGPYPSYPTVIWPPEGNCLYWLASRPVEFRNGQPVSIGTTCSEIRYFPPGYGLPDHPAHGGGYFWSDFMPICTEEPPVFPPTPTPAPGPSPPASGPAPCVAICGMDELISALKGGGDGQKCGKWKAWKDSETGECYVQPSDKEPRHGLDEFILESSDAAALVAAVNESCKPKEKPAPEKPLPRPEAPNTPVTGCDWILPVEIQGAAQVVNPVGFFLGVTDADGNPRPIPAENSGSWFWGPLARYYASFWRTVGEKLGNLFNAVLRSNPCISGANIGLIGMRAALNFLSIFVGDSLSQVKTPLTQHSNFLCPVGMPDYAQATQAWLRNAISIETRDCWVRACGMRPELWGIVAEAQRSRMSPDQLTRLYFRGELGPQEFADGIRELGFLRPEDPDMWVKLGKQIPGPSDLVRFMLRDVADPGIVNKFGLDDLFKDKFQGELVRQAKAQGLDEATMRDYWRAHWSIPSPSQLYEMYHRLRNRPGDDPNRVSLDDITTALEQQDILPYWIPKLLETSFRPLRLVDTRRAYFSGSIDQDEVRRTYEAVGYSDRDADILVQFQAKEKADAFVRGPWGRKYLAGGVSGQELDRKAETLGFSGFEIVYIRGQLAELLEANRKVKCSGNVRRRQLRGELDKIEAANALQGVGLDGDQALALAETWACERATRGKEFNGGQLCKLYAEGLITGPQFVARLESAGWTRDDAVRLYTLCSTDLERKRRAEEIRKIRQAEADQERERAKAEKAQRQLLADEAKQAQAGERLTKLNQARNKVLVDAGAAWAKRLGGDLSEAIDAARRTYTAISRTTTLPKDDIIKAVHVASRASSVENEDQWLQEALSVAQGQVQTITPLPARP